MGSASGECGGYGVEVAPVIETGAIDEFLIIRLQRFRCFQKSCAPQNRKIGTEHSSILLRKAGKQTGRFKKLLGRVNPIPRRGAGQTPVKFPLASVKEVLMMRLNPGKLRRVNSVLKK